MRQLLVRYQMKFLVTTVLLASLGLASQKTVASSLAEEQGSINKHLLRLVVAQKTAKALKNIEATIALGDRDIQRLYYSKLCGLESKGPQERKLLELMPQGLYESNHFYIYTTLDAEDTIGVSAEEAMEASYLYYQYYDLAVKCVQKHRAFLARFAVMLKWISYNAEVAELIDGWETELGKTYGAKFTKTVDDVWRVLGDLPDKENP